MATFFIILLFVLYYIFCLSYILRASKAPDAVLILICWILVPWVLGNAFCEVFDKHYKDGSD